MPGAAELAARLALQFNDLRLLEQALVHSSYINEWPDSGAVANERLEFLGDAVVSIVISEALWSRYPDEDEGSLTTRRAAIVSARGLARIASRLDLGRYLLLGQGAAAAGERSRHSVLAGALEAVAGAVYLDLGLEAARAWLLRAAAPELEASRPVVALKAPKSRLQELTFASSGTRPDYRVVSEAGPQHDRLYVVEVLVGGRQLGRGEGRNRRDAETQAAAAALAELGEPA